MTGNEKARIGDPEKPNTWEHWTIYRSFNPLDTTEASNAKAEYTKLASDWSAAVETFAARIRRSSTSAWEGAAATASQSAIADYATRALELTPALNALSQQVTTTVNGVNNTRNGVGEPQNRPDSMWNLDGYDFIFAEPGSRSTTAINKARDEALQRFRCCRRADSRPATTGEPDLTTHHLEAERRRIYRGRRRRRERERNEAGGFEQPTDQRGSSDYRRPCDY
ncbi:hypothetical protein [Nocardia salmonicida]|uniref:hypothetical protein n=1 Tax=Nocardia salmonicida TaxID=53431 RepID=UPI003CE80F10